MRAPDPSLSKPAPIILMVAGEASGDSHGAELIQQLKEQNPRIRIIGVGGPRARPRPAG